MPQAVKQSGPRILKAGEELRISQVKFPRERFWAGNGALPRLVGKAGKAANMAVALLGNPARGCSWSHLQMQALRVQQRGTFSGFRLGARFRRSGSEITRTGSGAA